MDLALIEAARSGDEEAFASIARGSADRLFAVAHRILRDVGRAEDAVQQTLVTAWRELPALREVDRFEAWIHRILVHACYAEAKRASKWSANVVVLSVDGPATPDTTLNVATRDALDRGFRRFPPEQCAVFVLHHYLGWPVAEIAENLGVPLGTVKSRLHYATSSLRAALEADARTIDTSLAGADGMNENEFDRTARAWLEDGPNLMSDRALLSALEEIHMTRQRRAWWPARRATPVSIFARVAIAAVLVVGVGLVAVSVVPRQPDGSSVGGRHRRLLRASRSTSRT